MINFVLIFLCILVGVVLSRTRVLPADAHKGVSAWVLNVAMPALILRFVPEIEWGIHLLLPALTPVLVWTGAWVFVWLYDRRRKLSTASRTAMLVTCGLGNTGFIGYPMTAAFFGESELHHAILVDQFCFILFATLGAVTVMRAASEISKGSSDRLLKNESCDNLPQILPGFEDKKSRNSSAISRLFGKEGTVIDTAKGTVGVFQQPAKFHFVSW